MGRILKTIGPVFLVAVVIFIFFFTKIEAAIFDSQPIIFIQRTTNLITQRVSDIVYYLVMQSKYTFGNYTDPNTYPTWQVADNFDEAISAIASSSASANSPVIIFGAPIVVSTSTTPVIKQIVSPIENNSEIFKLTNQARQNESLNILVANAVLNNIANFRIDDLFDNQYFSHTSPDNKAVSDLAKSTGYNYLLIGENLALGNYESEAKIIEAWLASPGHKANILNPKYEELGVAIRDGLFNGQMSTIAVQVFAEPLSSCNKPSSSMKLLIDSSSKSIKEMQNQATPMYDNLVTLKNSPGLDRAYYNQKVQEYNYFAKKINDAVLALKNLVDYYNSQVSQYNVCIRL